jgi:hypothetical protein
MSASVSASASDVGLIVQGTLIFLSAIVGVFGYLIQAKMARKAEKRRREEDKAAKANDMLLHNIEEKLSKFIGPASALALASCRGAFHFRDSAAQFYPDESEAFQRERESQGKTMEKYWKATWSNVDTFVGKPIERLMSESPMSPFAKLYRCSFRANVRHTWGPLRDLLCRYSGHLMDWQSTEEFQRRWPSGERGILRNTFFTRMISFASEAELLVAEYWDKGDFSLHFPHVPFPMQISMYLLTMAGRVRQKMTDAGIGEHNSLSDEEEKKRLLLNANKLGVQVKTEDEEKSQQGKEKRSKSSKYAAAGGAAAGAATAAVVSALAK